MFPRYPTVLGGLVLLVALACVSDGRELLQISTFTGNIAVRLVHKGSSHRYELDFYENDQTAVRLGLDVPDMPPAGPPASFYTGTFVARHAC